MNYLTKSELFKLAHQIAKFRCKVYYGSYQKAFGVVLKELYAQGGQVWGWNVQCPKGTANANIKWDED